MKLLRPTAALLLAAGFVLAQAQLAHPASYTFKHPQLRTVLTDRTPPAPPPASPASSPAPPQPVIAQFQGSAEVVRLTHRIVLQASTPQRLKELVNDPALALSVSRTLSDTLVILESTDASSAAETAAKLSQLEGVEVCHPVMHRDLRRHSPYALAPNDPFFFRQWYLENRNPTNGLKSGLDLDIRSAWTISRGAGVIIGIGDDGIDSQHPDLAPNLAAGLQHSFVNLSDNGDPQGFDSNHGTAVAGIAAAAGNNKTGMSGVAPASKLASWVIFGNNNSVATEESFMDMFQYRSNVVSVQNHSWGNPRTTQLDVGVLENRGISNAVTFGRGGLGSIIVRSAGNNRIDLGNINDDAYANNPLVMAVGAVRSDGQTTRYTNPGACLLLSAPSAESNEATTAVDPAFPSMLTTDRVGADGFNSQLSDTNPELADYGFDATGFSGTSAAAPQISGLAALMLSAKPQLGYRDVQQLLVLSARQTHVGDPDQRTNRTGLVFSHNTGFGVPRAGLALRLAKDWSNRPPVTIISVSTNRVLDLPDDGLRVIANGPSVPTNLLSFGSTPSLGPHPDDPTELLPMVDVGLASEKITTNLQGKGALIFRSTPEIAANDSVSHTFSNKIAQAALAGASFAIVCNNRNSTERVMMAETDFVPIPAVFIDQTKGEALRLLLKQHPETKVGLSLSSARYQIEVKDSLLIERVGLQLFSSHRRRGDLRVTLVSPSGTRSILQRRGFDTTAGFGNWTYYSVQHLWENCAGLWSVEITDEDIGSVGSVSGATLIISGLPILDSDRDGLDDAWEQRSFDSLNQGPAQDFDGDGWSNLVEQLRGTDPTRNQNQPLLTLSSWSSDVLRLSWNSSPNQVWQVRESAAITGPFTGLNPLQIQGGFPETELMVPGNLSKGTHFFELRPAP